MKLRLTMMVVACLLGGCTRTFSMVGTFPQSNEVFQGEIVAHSSTGNADVHCRMVVNGTEGRGFAQVTYKGMSTSGQRGVFEINCDDGRLVKGQFVTESLTSGYGWGEDQYGNPVRFSFGMKPKLVPETVQAELAKASNRPALLPAGAPTTRPALGREVQK